MNETTRSVILALIGSAAFFSFLIVIANHIANRRVKRAEAKVAEKKGEAEAMVLKITGDISLSQNMLTYVTKLEKRIDDMQIFYDKKIADFQSVMDKREERHVEIVREKDVEIKNLNKRIDNLEDILRRNNITYEV